MLGLADDLKVRFKNIVNERTGLYFKDYALRDLEGAVSQRMKSLRLDSPLSYYNVLVMSAEKEDEFRELLNILTVNHTYFFRNEPQFKVLKDKILPEIIARKPRSRESGIVNRGSIHDPLSTIHETRPSLRIWSAGCSTGEEPYTIAIIISETIPDPENWDIKILATDASESALKKARKGEYPESAMKHIPPDYLDKYFKSTIHASRFTNDASRELRFTKEEAPMANKKILIIDDSRASVDAVTNALSGHDYQITSAGNGKDGIAAALKEKPDIVIVDIILPDINGLEVCKKIREKSGRSNPRIIALTGVIDAVDAVGARRAGADDFCVKSAEMSHLVEAVKKLADSV